MGRALDHDAIVGRQFNDWTVLGVEPGTEVRYRVRCACGSEASVLARSVRYGTSRRCNPCGNKVRGPQDGHGATRGGVESAEFRIWCGMLDRCTRTNAAPFPRYGGRGIRVCERWSGKEGFANFFADMGPRPSPRHSIDRYPNNDGNYEPANCRWATDSEQAFNRRPRRRP